jgi:hypothetical protein
MHLLPWIDLSEFTIHKESNMAGVYLFNSMAVGLNIIFNAGAPITIAGTSDSAQWVPVSPATEPTFVNNPNPGPGQIGLGSNTMTVYPSSLPPSQAKQVTVTIPTNIQINSLQLYVFWSSANEVSWVLLQQGQPIGGSITL